MKASRAGELEESKRSIVASFALSLEQPSRALDFAITRKLYGLPADYWDAYASQDRRGDRPQTCSEWRANISIPTRCNWSPWATPARSKRCLEKVRRGGCLRQQRRAQCRLATFSPHCQSILAFKSWLPRVMAVRDDAQTFPWLLKIISLGSRLLFPAGSI